MRSLHGLRIRSDRTGEWADCECNSSPQARNSDRCCWRLAASFDACCAIGPRCAARSAEPNSQEFDRTLIMPGFHTARRIACLQPSATVILDAVGELGRVVACTRYCADVVPSVADGSRIILADSWTADTAQIVAAQPALVI